MAQTMMDPKNMVKNRTKKEELGLRFQNCARGRNIKMTAKILEKRYLNPITVGVFDLR